MGVAVTMYLFLQGVRNVTRALNIARYNNYHDIIGTLLRHIALESNKESLDNKSCELFICLSVGVFVCVYNSIVSINTICSLCINIYHCS